jgi:hypothetical protein
MGDHPHESVPEYYGLYTCGCEKRGWEAGYRCALRDVMAVMRNGSRHTVAWNADGLWDEYAKELTDG